MFNRELIGTWVRTSDGESYTIARLGEKRYRVVPRKGEKKKPQELGELEVTLGRLNESWFLDSSPSKDGGNYHSIPAHIFSKMTLNGDTLQIASLDEKWLGKMINSKRLAIAHIQTDDRLLLTASTAELRDLVIRFAGDHEAFANWDVLVRISGVQQNKDSIIANLNQLALHAYQFRIRPAAMAGGGGSYLGYSMSVGLASNENATFTSTTSAQSITFIGTSSQGYGTVAAVCDSLGRLGSFTFLGLFH